MRFILEMDYSPVNWILSWLSVKNLLPLTSSWSLDVIQSLSHVQLFWPHGLQHARFPCPSLSPGIYPNSCPLSQWCHPTVSSSVAPSPPVLSLSQLQSLFEGLLFASADASASALVLPMNIQSWFPWGLIGLIFLQSKGLSRVFSSTTIQKHQFFGTQPCLWSNFHIHTWQLEKL